MEKLKATIDYGKEKEFIEFCNDNSITYKQYPNPIKWAFRVEIEENSNTENIKNQIRGFRYLRTLEPMPLVTLSQIYKNHEN